MLRHITPDSSLRSTLTLIVLASIVSAVGLAGNQGSKADGRRSDNQHAKYMELRKTLTPLTIKSLQDKGVQRGMSWARTAKDEER